MSAATTRRIALPIDGMSCAACAARIERTLNRLDGVQASVNYATERAAVEYDPARLTPSSLVEAVAGIGYEARLPHEAAARDDASAGLRTRLVVSAALSVPVLVLGMAPGTAWGGRQWLALALATPVVLWGGRPFHHAAWTSLRHRAATMDTLVSLGTLVAWGWSVVTIAFLGAGSDGAAMGLSLTSSNDGVYLEPAALVVTFLLAGRFFEARAKRRAGAALLALAGLGAKDVALVASDGGERLAPVAELRVGDLFVVRPGERIAADGIVTTGSSALDRSLLTGESTPLDVGPGDEVAAATVNLGGRLVVRAQRVGSETALARITALVEEAQVGKAPVQRLADRVAAVFVPIVLALAAATFAVWLASGAGPAFALSASVAVLIVACPCALGLATPTALLVGTGRGAQLGILIRGPEVLESTRRIDTVVLDKTGTVTRGRPSLVALTAAPGTSEAQALRLAGSLEAASEHPAGRAIASAAARRGPLDAVESFAGLSGLGVEGRVGGRDVLVGRPMLLAGRGLALDPSLAAVVDDAEREGRTAVAAAWDGRARAVFILADTVKPTSAEAVAELTWLGLRPILLTGDNEQAAQAVAAEVGIEHVIAGVLPAGKAEAVARLQESGAVVAMVGDGVNDAPALAQADLGIAIGTGTDVAIEAGDLTLVSGDLRATADAIRLSRRTLATIKGNLFWAFAYNVAAIPLAAAGYLSPLVAGAAMALSSLFVVSNSLRLRGFRPRRRGAL